MEARLGLTRRWWRPRETILPRSSTIFIVRLPVCIKVDSSPTSACSKAWSQNTPVEWAISYAIRFAFLPCGHFAFWVSGQCTKWRIKVSFWQLVFTFVRRQNVPRNSILASILTDESVQCNCRNINCAQGKQNLHSRRIFISTFTIYMAMNAGQRTYSAVTSGYKTKRLL